MVRHLWATPVEDYALTSSSAALAGYETVTGFDSNFNITQDLWFHRFLPSYGPKPGTLCDPRLLSLGDTITTNSSLFQYTIASIDTANAGDSGFSYEGWTLENCDITSLFVNADANTFIIDFTALVSCQASAAQILQGNNYEITVRADWPMSTLSGQYASLLGVQKAIKNRGTSASASTVDAFGKLLDAVTSVSSNEFATRVFLLMALTNGTFPTIISFEADFPWCPASLGRDAPCALQVPPLNVTSMFEYAPNGKISQYFASIPGSTPLITNDTAGIMSNLVQAAYAAVRLDLGNPSPNNFLLNSSMIGQAITASLPQTFPQLPGESYLYSVLVGDGYYASATNATIPDVAHLLPLKLPGPAVLDGVYLCRFQRVKSPGSAFIAVLVATLSMFSSGWAIFLRLAAGMVKKRQPGGKQFHFLCGCVLTSCFSERLRRPR
jgi:hypothetical protein